MMIFTIDQLEWLKARAMLIVNELKHRESRSYTWDDQASYTAGHLQEVCEMGYGIAMSEVHSTPWEFLKTVTEEEAMNEAASEGWELMFPCDMDHTWLIWRRRKGAA